MSRQIKPSEFLAGLLIKLAISGYLLLGSAPAAVGQITSQANPDNLYAAVELSAEGIKAAAFRFFPNEEPNLRLVYSEFVRLPLWRSDHGKFSPQVVAVATQTAQKLLSRLDQQYHVPVKHIYLIGSCGLGADRPEDLVSALGKATSKTLNFLDAETDVQLGIVGTIPQREKVGSTLIDNRDSSVLIEIGSDHTKGGYQLLKYPTSGPPRYGSITMNIPLGTMSFANEISRNMESVDDLPTFIQRADSPGTASFRQALRKEQANKPGLVNRERIYLTGDIVWALVTLLSPENRQTFVPITAQDVAAFADKATAAPWTLLNPDLSRIRNRKLRGEIEQELEAVRNTFMTHQLIAGAELLKAVAGEFNFQEKKVWYARYGHLGRILSYLRLQVEK